LRLQQLRSSNTATPSSGVKRDDSPYDGFWLTEQMFSCTFFIFEEFHLDVWNAKGQNGPATTKAAASFGRSQAAGTARIKARHERIEACSAHEACGTCIQVCGARGKAKGRAAKAARAAKTTSSQGAGTEASHQPERAKALRSGIFISPAQARA
jgi:hypothetical protein